MTPQEIIEYKLTWKPGFEVVVHSDLDWKCKDWCRKTLDRHQWSMDNYTHVYAHTFRFEHEEHADAFREEFKDWVDKGTR